MPNKILSIKSKELSNSFNNVQQVFEREIFALVSPIQTLNEKDTACVQGAAQLIK